MDKKSDYGHERTDIRPAAALAIGVGLALLTGAGLLLMFWLFGYLESASEERTRLTAPLPASEADPPTWPEDQLQRLRNHEKRMLGGYEWVDRENGIVRIPIEAAMELTAARGAAERGKDEGGER